MATMRLSTGLRNSMMGQRADVSGLMTATTIAFVDGGGGNDSITDSGSGFLTAGFLHPHRNITVVGSTSNNDTFEMLSVVAGTIEVPTGSLTAETAGDQVVLAESHGGSFEDLFRNGVVHIYGGTMPTDPDAAISGSILAIISESSLTFVSGAPANGINFDVAASGAVSKRTDETWSGTGLVAGTASWGVFYPNTVDATASTTAVRFLFDVATSGAIMTMANTLISVSGTTTVDSCSFTLPAV